MRCKLLHLITMISKYLFYGVLLQVFTFSVLFGYEGETRQGLSAGSEQDVTVTGTVTSNDDGIGLPGVNVLVKGSTIGTVTDVDGNYSLEVPSRESILVFSSIGYVSEEVAVGDKSTINIAMVPDITSLSEVVVIGYGKRSKKDLTGAISEVGTEAVEKTAAMSPQMAMQGRMPGVLVQSPGGDPTARPTVRIRGVGTWGYAEPLYVIDGIPVTEAWAESDALNEFGSAGDIRGSQNILNTINPADIESISVLKDASAASIYGVRAANGVILITTKQGERGKPKVTFNASAGIQNITNTYDVLNTQQLAELSTEMLNNNDPNLIDSDPANWGWYNPDSSIYVGNLPYNTDWQEEGLNKNALIQDYSVSISGGNEGSTYYTSFGYSQQESPMKWKKTDRLSIVLNSEHKLKDWLTIGENFRYSYVAADNNGVDLDGLSSRPPWQPIYDPDGVGGFAAVDTDIYGPTASGNGFGIRSVAGDRNDYNTFRTLGNVFVELSPFDGFRIKGTVHIDLTDIKRIQNENTAGNIFKTNPRWPGYWHRERVSSTRNIQKEVLLGYNKSFGDHNLDFIANGSWQEIEEKFVQGASIDGVYDNAGVIDEASSTAVSRVNENALVGFLGRLSYNYGGKYYLDLSLRRDGTSRFADGYRWGTFPSVSGAWRISSESFLDGVTFIDDLKLRGGWGQLGNQVTALYQYLSLANLNPKYLAGGNDASSDNNLALPGVYFPSLPNEILSWETVETLTIGLDGLFFNDALSLTAEYYVRDTKDILQSVDIPAVAGYQETPFQNIGQVTNKGIELNANYKFSAGDFDFNVGGNFTTVNNEVISLYNDVPLTRSNNRRIEEGQPIDYIYGFEVDGIFQDQAEIDEWAQGTQDTQGSTKSPGDIRFRDIHGESMEEGVEKTIGPDSVINSFDRTYLGSDIPGYYYGFNIGAKYKGFDFSILFQGVGDVQDINGARRGGESMDSPGNNRWTTVLDRWTQENPSTTMPRAVYNDPASNQRFSDRWVEDADFMRIKNVQLGYTFSDNILSKIGSSNMRVYFDASNLATFTSWTGLDPEGDGVPLPVILRVGVNASF